MSDKYWNGYQWVTPAKPGVEVVYDVPSHEERVALLEAEVNPPDVTEERELVELFEQPIGNMVTIPLTLYPEKVVHAPLKEIPDDPTPEITPGHAVELAREGEEASRVYRARVSKMRHPIITDEVRARVRRELEAKDGGSK